MTTKKVFSGPTLHPRQIDLFNALCAHFYTLAYGTARGGKTFCIIDYIVQRAMVYPGSSHLALRLTGNSIKGTIWKDSLLPVLDAYGMRDKVELNLTDLTCTFPNGSVIAFSGVQDDERIQKILGAQYQTIYLNEATNIEFDVYELVKSRLNGDIFSEDGRKIDLKVIADCNPTDESHWLYSLFIENIVPGTDRPVADPSEYCAMWFDDKANPDAQYGHYKDASEATRRRFLEGVWTKTVKGALFAQDDLENTRRNTPDPSEFDMIVIGVDPAMTADEKSDETGIVVAGMIQEGDVDHYYPLADLSGRYHPNEWARIIVKAYHDYGAGLVVIERTQGGELNSNNIHTIDPRLAIVTVNPGAGQGKNARAMPIASLMREKRIHHPFGNEFEALEKQMLVMTGDYDRRKKDSPDRLDAYVYAISELLTGDGPIKPVVVSKIANYFR